MTGDYSIRRYGTDSSKRPILMTAFMHDWWTDVCSELDFKPVIIQGAFMSQVGGGAKESAGYHDQAGCIDVRTRDLTDAQITHLVHVCRANGAAAWRRDAAHGGMDPHCHITLGADFPLSDGARTSWHSYVTGGDGLAGSGRDYEWRPVPLVLEPPEDPMLALLADLKALAKARNVSLVYLARVALFGATDSNTGGRRARIRTARATLKGMI